MADLESESNLLQLKLDEGWSFESRGAYGGNLDRRALFQIYHSWVESKSGDYGLLKRAVKIPENWKPPFRLYFYCTDDYVADDWRPKAGEWLGGEGFFGHRFKELLIGGKVVWESDVAGEEPTGARKLTEVDITRYISPGKTFELAFRVMDRVGSAEKLHGDFHHTGDTETSAEKPGDPARFMTHVYLGDITIVQGESEEIPDSPGKRPSFRPLEEKHHRRWPIPPFGDYADGPALLEMELPTELPESGFPLTCGIPLPAGKVADPEEISLTDGTGKAVPFQAQILTLWRDRSIRWLLLDARAKPENSQSPWRLELHPKTVAKTAIPVDIVKEGNAIRISTGAISLSVGRDKGVLIDKVYIEGEDKPIAWGFRGRVVIKEEEGEETLAAVWDDIEVTSDGPLRGAVELRGKITNGKVGIGRFTFRVHAYSGMNLLGTSYRVFNGTGETLEISDLSLSMKTRLGDGSTAFWGLDEDSTSTGRPPVSIHQIAADSYSVTSEGREIASGKRSGGWIGASDGDGSILAAVRYTWQEFPKALHVEPGSVRVGLFAPSDSLALYRPHPGEAKRNEVLLGFYGGELDRAEAQKVARCFQRPPRLFSAEWFALSGGFEYCYPHGEKEFQELHTFMETNYGDVSPEKFGALFGIREFPDRSYYSSDKRSNNYYDAMQGLFGEYLMEGGRKWFDRAEEMARHFMDIDICHSSVEHPELVGAVHTTGLDHSNWSGGGPWAAMMRASGLNTYYRLTGDPDAEEAFVGVADFIVRSGIGLGAVSVRDHAGPITTLMRAYDETAKPEYLDAAEHRVKDTLRIIDSRRGTYPEIHGNYSYRGNVPWMCAQLAEPIYLFYRASGKLWAADIVVGLAESMICENMTEIPGDFYGYSHNPHFKKTSNYNVLIAPVMGYAYELTGDPEFLRAMRGAYRITIDEGTVNWVLNCYWNTPTLLYYLHKYSGDTEK